MRQERSTQQALFTKCSPNAGDWTFNIVQRTVNDEGTRWENDSRDDLYRKPNELNRVGREQFKLVLSCKGGEERFIHSTRPTVVLARGDRDNIHVHGSQGYQVCDPYYGGTGSRLSTGSPRLASIF